MINDMGKAARQWPERVKLTLNSVVLLAFCFCTLHTMTLLRVPVFWLSFTNIRFYIFYTCLSRNHSQMLCKAYFITSIVFFFLGVPMLALFHFLIISSNFLCKSNINLENHCAVPTLFPRWEHTACTWAIRIVLCCAVLCCAVLCPYASIFNCWRITTSRNI